MLVSTGNEIFVSDSSDSRTMDNARTFLNNLIPTLAAYDLQLQIKNQSDVLSKAEKKYKSLQNDADDLQKKKKKVEQQIEDNLKDQKNQQAEIEKQRQIYESLHSRQKM
jgi:peptidoglycan hydrolase CwlO-like protein